MINFIKATTLFLLFLFYLVLLSLTFRHFFKQKLRKKKILIESKEECEEFLPLSGNCDFCNKRISLPFKCRKCGGLFCIDHRLPENHNCK